MKHDIRRVLLTIFVAQVLLVVTGAIALILDAPSLFFVLFPVALIAAWAWDILP